MALAEVWLLHSLADGLQAARHLQRSWVNNQLSFAQFESWRSIRGSWAARMLLELEPHLDWSSEERRQRGSATSTVPTLANSTELGSDGFVTSLSNPFPELAVAIWDSVQVDDAERAFRLQSQFSRLARLTGFGPMLACLEVLCRHRGLLNRMLPAPLRSVDAETARRIVEEAEAIGASPALAETAA